MMGDRKALQPWEIQSWVIEPRHFDVHHVIVSDSSHLQAIWGREMMSSPNLLPRKLVIWQTRECGQNIFQLPYKYLYPLQITGFNKNCINKYISYDIWKNHTSWYKGQVAGSRHNTALIPNKSTRCAYNIKKHSLGSENRYICILCT